MSVLNEMRRAVLEHISTCEHTAHPAYADIREEREFYRNEIFIPNIDIDFTNFPEITISHECTWVACDWTQEKTITMIEASE